MRHNIIRQGNRTINLLFFLIFSFIPILCMIATANAETITYDYYDTGELKTAIYSSGSTVQYVYDLSGNRTTQVVTAGKPAISISPTSLNFGQLIVGSSSAPQSITITNTGTESLVIESATIAGGNASEFTKQTDTCSGQALAASATCTICIVFSAQAPAASKTATLQIVSNAPDSPLLSASLSGIVFDHYNILTITKAGTGDGTVSVVPGEISWNGNIGTANYAPGTNMNISATASAGSIFISWAGACMGNSNPCAVTMSANTAVTATFDSEADFSGTPINGTAPLTVGFTDLSIHNPISWLWNFGDGETSAERNPSHTYRTPGVYTVTLTATGIGGPVTMTKQNYIVVVDCADRPVKLGGSSVYYQKIQDAYNISASGDAVQMQALGFTEALTLDHNTSVLLQGGYGCDYSSNPGVTTINGIIEILDGTVTIEKVDIQ